jgi:hypothetical protein
MVSPERIFVVSEKIGQTARLAQRMDVIAENFAKVPGLDRKAAMLGQDIRVPPKVAADVEEFEQCVIALERLFNISGFTNYCMD